MVSVALKDFRAAISTAATADDGGILVPLLGAFGFLHIAERWGKSMRSDGSKSMRKRKEGKK